MSVSHNPSLTSLRGASSLATIGFGLVVRSNRRLASLQDLAGAVKQIGVGAGEWRRPGPDWSANAEQEAASGKCCFFGGGMLVLHFAAES